MSKESKVKKLGRKVFAKTVKFLSRGYGLGQIGIVSKIYTFFISLVKDENVKCVEVNGSKMYLDPEDRLSLSVFGAYEVPETDLVKKEIRNGMTVVDIGANIGYYTLLFSGLVGKSGRVFAFEPDPANFYLLQKNANENKRFNVVLENKAVSQANGFAKLYIGENRTDDRIFDPGEKRKIIDIATIALDDYFKSLKLFPDFIKMDIQGAEIYALRGM